MKTTNKLITNSLLAIALAVVLIPRALPAEPGQLKWSFTTGGPVSSSPAVGADGTVYVGSMDGNVYALDGATGARRWAFLGYTASSMSSAAVGANGMVYFAKYDVGGATVYALHGATGAKKWAFAYDHTVPGYSSPAVGADGTVYTVLCVQRGPFPSWSLLFALDGASGAEKWIVNLNGYATSSPAVGSDGTVYIGSDNGQVYALNGVTGARKWAFVAGGDIGYSSPAIGTDGTVYVGSDDGKVYALDGTTGANKWTVTTGGRVRSSPAIGADGTVYVGSADGKVHALDGATGAEKWAFVTGETGQWPLSSSPAIGADGTVYVGSDDGKVYALEGATGTRKWAFATGGCVLSSPALGADGTVYVGSDDGKVYALHGSSGLANSPWPKFRQNAENTGQSSGPPTGRPKIITEPLDGRFIEGSTATLRVRAVGDPPLSYQWFFEGDRVPGATNASLTLTKVQFSQTGDYLVTLSNSLGATTSRTARVTVGFGLALATRGSGSVVARPVLDAYAPGDQVELQAVPNSGRPFVKWSGDVASTTNPLTLTINGHLTVVAEFSLLPGDLIWTFATGDLVDSSPALGADGTVYVGSNDGRVYALDGTTGVQQWGILTDGPVRSSPAVGADGTVYVGSAGKRVYALNGATGAQRWAFLAGYAVNSSPAIGTDGTVYVGASEFGPTSDMGVGNVYALDGATGIQRWAFRVAGSLWSSPAIGADGTLYIGSGDGHLYALDGTTGIKKWASRTGGAIDSSPAIGPDGTVYVQSSTVSFPQSDHQWLQAIDPITELTKWERVFHTEWGGSLGGSLSSPAIGAHGTVYVGMMDQNVYAVDGATGAQKWAFLTGAYVYSSPAIAADGTIYVGSGGLFALDAVTGAQKWVFTLGFRAGFTYSSPAIGADGTVYFGASNGKVYAVQGTSGLADSPWPKFHQNAQNTGHGPFALRVLGQPSWLVLKEGAAGQIAFRVAGQPPPSFQWLFNSQPVPGATQAILTIPSVARADEGVYTVVASNSVGQATSQPITAVVSNVDPQSFVGLKWEGGNVGTVGLEATVQLGELAAWHSISNYPSSGTTQLYVELDPGDATRFYRLNAPAALQFSTAGLLNGWWLVNPAGTRIRIEMVSAATGWTNWQVLTTLTLPVSPYLFIDQESLAAPERVYRTTVVP